MKVLALLAHDSRQAVERALGSAHTVKAVRDVRSIVKALYSRKFQALVLDPVLLDERQLDALSPMLESAAVPVVLYADLSAALAKSVIRIAERGTYELILRGREEDPGLLLRKLQMLVEHSAPALLLSRVASHLAAFPPALQTLAVGLYARGSLPRWVRDVANDTGYGRRTIDRWMVRAGLRGTATLLDTARLAHVWEPLVERRLSPRAAGTLCGYANPRMLNAHANRLVGVAPVDFASSFTRSRFVDRLTRALLADGA
jgi:hypothetical protein